MADSKLLNGFLKPHQDYHPATMWFWNDDLTEEEITIQLEKFKAAGINDFFVNAIEGATYEYLGEEFFKAVKHAAKEAARLGMSFWIYDEFNWPSGVAGGAVLRDHPEARAKILKNTKCYLSPKETIQQLYIKGDFAGASIVWLDCPEEGAVDVSKDVVIEKNEYGFWISYMNERCTTVALHIMSVQYQDTVLPCCRWGKYTFEQQGYVDPMDEKAIRIFIDYTHEKYKEAIGEYFGTTVKGLFTDEVCTGAPHDLSRSRVPWNDEIKAKFFAKYGYDITPWLYALVEKPSTAKEKQVRYHYWKLTAELVETAHIKQVYEWCDKENIAYTGHFNGEESQIAAMFQGDLFQMMKWQHVPGIDSILSRTKINDEMFNVPGKIVASCAKYYNRERTLCETYTVSTDKFRFDEKRRIANRLLTLGVNMIQYMGAIYSKDGARKTLPGPSFGYNNSMFKHLDHFGDYVARVQQLSAKTKPAGRVMLMWTQADLYANFDGRKDMAEVHFNRPDHADAETEITFIGLVNALLEMNVEYDIFGDSMAADMSAENGVAKFYGGDYDTVIIPSTKDTTSEVVEMVERLKAAGVKTVFVDELPQLMVDKAEAAAPYGAIPQDDGLFCVGDNAWLIKLSRENKYLGKNQKFKAMLEDVLGNDCRTLDIRHNGDIITGLRRAGDSTVVFMCNDANEAREASIRYVDGMLLLNPDTGNVVPLENKGGRATVRFTPYQMYVVTIGEQAEFETEDTAASAELLKVLPVCSVEPVGGNVLVPERKFAPYEHKEGPIVLPEEDKLIPIPGGFVPGKYSGLGQGGVIVFDFEMKYIPESVTLFAEYGETIRCELNGERIDDKWSPCRLWGVKDACLEVAPMLKPGKNRIAITFSVLDYAMAFQPPFAMLRGDFEVERFTVCEKRKAYTAAPVNQQGHPRFYGDVDYNFSAVLAEQEVAEAKYITIDTREVVELFVNGVPAGKSLWAPHRFNVEGMLEEGENKISVRTTLPMWNLFCREGDGIDMGLTCAPIIEKKA